MLSSHDRGDFIVRDLEGGRPINYQRNQDLLGVNAPYVARTLEGCGSGARVEKKGARNDKRVITLPVYSKYIDKIYISNQQTLLFVLLVVMGEAASVQIEAALQLLLKQIPLNLKFPTFGIICGSGLNSLSDILLFENRYEITYTSIPHFPQSTGISLSQLNVKPRPVLNGCSDWTCR